MHTYVFCFWSVGTLLFTTTDSKVRATGRVSAYALGAVYKSVSICASASSVNEKTANETTVGWGGLLDVDVDSKISEKSRDCSQ